MSQLNLSGRKRLKLTMAGERNECGIACLVMIANYFGHQIDLNYLRQRLAISHRGTSLRVIRDAATHLFLGPRAFRVDVEELNDLALPAILHWDLNHYIVLDSVQNGTYRVFDPAKGKLSLSQNEVREKFSGVVLEFSPDHNFDRVKSKSKYSFFELVSGGPSLRGIAVRILLLSLVYQAAILVAPFYLQIVVDQVIASGNNTLLKAIALGFALFVLIQVSTEFLRNWALQAFNYTLSYFVVSKLSNHLVKLPLKFFESRHTGDIVTKFGCVRLLREALVEGLSVAFVDGFLSILVLVLMFIYSPLLTAVVVLFLIVLVLVNFFLLPRHLEYQDESIIIQGEAKTELITLLTNIESIKIMNRESERFNKWINSWTRFINASFSVVKIKLWLGSSQSLINGLQLILIVYMGAELILNGSGFSVGMLFAFLGYRQTLTTAMTNLINQFFKFKLVSLHLRQVGEILQSKTELNNKLSGVKSDCLGNIKLQQVSFRYSKHDPLILENINLDIRAGSFIAITGPSGGGKSTLIKLILGLYPLTDGKLILDDILATPELCKSWRENVGVVSQNERLLTGTIAENIAFSDMRMNMAEVESAAKKAGIHDEIMNFPMQYFSLVGDLGTFLSGGQVQRVLLARALYRNPKVLILDEGTANLDPETERHVADHIDKLEITRIVIAHRPELVDRASQVYEIRNGGCELIR